MKTDRLGMMAVKQAREAWGRGWQYLSEEQRQGAVALRMAYMLLGQDMVVKDREAPLARMAESFRFAINAVSEEQ